MRRLFCAIFIVTFGTGLDVFFGRTEVIPFRPWILFFVSSALLAGFGLESLRKIVRWSISRILYWLPICLVVALYFVSLIQSDRPMMQVLMYATHPAVSIFTLVIGGMLYLMIPAHSFWRFWIGWCFALLSVTIVLDVFMVDLFSTAPGRAAGTRINANDAALLVVAYLAFLISPKTERLVTSTAAWWAAGFMLALTASRGGIAIAAILCGLWTSRVLTTPSVETRKNRILATAMVALMMVGLIWYGFKGTSGETGLAARSEVMLQTSSERRYSKALATIEMIHEKPLRGHGPEASKLSQPHNVFLAISLDSGIPAAILYAAILIGAIWKFRRQEPARSLLIVIGAAGLLSDTVIYDRALLLLTGVAMAEGVSTRKVSSSDDPDAGPPRSVTAPPRATP